MKLKRVPMKIVRDIREMQTLAEKLRLQGKRIAFVPTMGYLHKGHLSLMKEGRERADTVVASIFVNPTQFGPQEDLDAYPRDFENDEKLMRDMGVDVVFYPAEKEIYPEGYQTYVTVEQITRNLCGASRPVHFRGVATVVTKLFNIVKPHVAIFGDKDFQQRRVIQRMARDLNFDVEVIGCPTVREPDGLAMSSRNAYLSPEERKEALAIKRALDGAGDLYRNGVCLAEELMTHARTILAESPNMRLDYMKICDTETMEAIDEIENEAVLAIATFMGNTRLIDNIVFSEPAR
jgi:pantoate--beta-alanine ligase